VASIQHFLHLAAWLLLRYPGRSIGRLGLSPVSTHPDVFLLERVSASMGRFFFWFSKARYEQRGPASEPQPFSEHDREEMYQSNSSQGLVSIERRILAPWLIAWIRHLTTVQKITYKVPETFFFQVFLSKVQRQPGEGEAA
jgi:hypothetical protein